MISVVVAEDHSIVREGVVALLERAGTFNIVGEAEDGLQAVELCQELKPDVLVLDIAMPKMNGIEVVNEVVKSLKLDVNIVILSMYSDLEVIRQAFLNGARGYLLKQAVTEELILAVKAAARRETYISPAVAGPVVDKAIHFKQPSRSFDPYEILTSRERQVLQLIAEGRTNKEMANLMGIADRTVEKHRANLIKKLDAKDVASLVKIAIKYRIIWLDE